MSWSPFKKKKPKIVFFGTPEFCLPTLEKCYDLFDVVAVVTQPDRPRGRGQKLSPCPVKEYAQNIGTPTHSPESLKKSSRENTELKEFLLSKKIDLFVVLAYGNLLPKWALDTPRLGAVNLHASLLPKWRGAAPIQRALEYGNNSTGVCLQKMVAKMDAGDILHEKKYLIGPLENAESLSESLSMLSSQVLEEYFTTLFKGKLEGRAQNEIFVTFANKISKEEAIWSPEWTSTQTHNKARAFFLWPKLKISVDSNNTNIAILRTRLEHKYSGPHLEPGQIHIESNHVYMGSKPKKDKEPVLELVKVQPPGKGPLNAHDYFQNLTKDREKITLCTPS